MSIGASLAVPGHGGSKVPAIATWKASPSGLQVSEGTTPILSLNSLNSHVVCVAKPSSFLEVGVGSCRSLPLGGGSVLSVQVVLHHAVEPVLLNAVTHGLQHDT